MSIATNLQRLVTAKSDIADAITAKGGTVNQGDGFEEFPADIATIPSGGGSVDYTDRVGRGTMDITSISKTSQPPPKHYFPNGVISANSYVLTTLPAYATSSTRAFYGRHMWTDGSDVYYSYGSTHYILDKENSIWFMKIWFNVSSWDGCDVWTDGENTYLSNYTSHYIFNKTKDTWEGIIWYGIDAFYGQDVWRYGEDIYCSNGTATYRLDKASRTWVTVISSDTINGRYVWNLDGNAYRSYYKDYYNTYNQRFTGSGWVSQSWSGYYPQTGDDVYTYNGKTYYFNGNPATTSSSPSRPVKRGSVYNPTTNTWDSLLPTSYESSSYYGRDFWTDGDKCYISSQYGMRGTSIDSYYDIQYELTETGDKINKTWTIPSTELYDYRGANIWSDGDNIYLSSYTDSTPHHYVLSKDHILLWYEKTWNGFTSVIGEYIWTDGENTYYSNGSSQYVLNKETDTWETKTWTGLTSFTGSNIWTVDDNIYYSNDSSQYVLDKTTSTWSTKTWSGLTSFKGQYIWTYNNDVYYSYGSSQYVLDKATSTWIKSGIASMTSGSYSIGGNAIWTDGAYICYTYVSGSYSTYYTGSKRLNKETGVWEDYTLFPKVGYSSYKNINPAIWSDGIYTYAIINGNTYILPRYVAEYS